MLAICFMEEVMDRFWMCVDDNLKSKKLDKLLQITFLSCVSIVPVFTRLRAPLADNSILVHQSKPALKSLRENDAGANNIVATKEDSNGHVSSASDVEDEDRWMDTCDIENNVETNFAVQSSKEESNGNRKKPVIDTLFSTLDISFLNMIIDPEGGIPTQHFLKSCSIVITIFDMFGSPIFAPMKMDVAGNLKKITNIYNNNPSEFMTLQDIVRHELHTNTTTARNSGTDALLWLKRGLEFVYEFLLEFSRGNPDLKNSALNAYNRSLKQYHGWIVRGVISAATHTVPSRHEVLTKLALRPNDIHNPLYEEQLKEDARLFLIAMDNIIKIINGFYARHNLDRKEVV